MAGADLGLELERMSKNFGELLLKIETKLILGVQTLKKKVKNVVFGGFLEILTRSTKGGPGHDMFIPFFDRYFEGDLLNAGKTCMR